MNKYIDGFVLPVPRNELQTYKEVVEKVAEVWKEHGALDYSEFVCNESNLEGTRSFLEAANASEDDVVIFGWVTFESREMRDLINERIASDPRMPELTAPLDIGEKLIFDAKKMVYGGFQCLV